MARAKKDRIVAFDPRLAFIANGHTYDSSNSLKLWHDFRGASPLDDKSGNGNDGSTYSVTISDVPDFRFVDARSIEFQAGELAGLSTNLLGLLSNSNSFSFSFWVKQHSPDSIHDVQFFGIGTVNELTLAISSVDGHLIYRDLSWSGTTGQTSYSAFQEDVWTHVTITIDRSSPQLPIVYYNGVVTPHGASATPTGTKQTTSLGIPYLGNGNATTGTITISSFAIWTTVLSADCVSAIYNSFNGTHRISSGFLSNPSQVMLQERDCAIGTYPTITRAGDPDFSGDYNIAYDDTDTINFVGQSIIYPTGLPAKSKWISSSIATPNILQGLTALGTSSKGVADVHVSFTQGQNTSPFNESRLAFDASLTTIFTGTNQNILPGFNQRLGSKVSLSFDTNPTLTTNVVFSTGTSGPHSSGLAQGVNTGIAYYNWSTNVWDIIGDVSTGSAPDYTRGYPWVTGTMLAIANSTYQNALFSDSNFGQMMDVYGLPVPTAGFPLATKFNPSTGQVLLLTGVINTSLLLENVSLQLSCTLGSRPFGLYSNAPSLGTPNITFMLLKHTRLPNTLRSVNRTILANESYNQYNPGPVYEFTDSFQSDSFRDIIWTHRVGQFSSGSGNTQFKSLSDLASQRPSGYRSCDTWFPVNFDTNHYMTGVIELQGPVKTVAGLGNVIPPAAAFGSSDGSIYFSTIPLGVSRDLFSPSNGRSFINSVVGMQQSGSSFTTSAFSSNALTFQPVTRVQIESPYLLYPEDGLVLVAVYQAHSISGNTLGNYNQVTKNPTILSPGAGRLQLYGSLLRNNLPVSPESNQPLTSNAIHEDLHYDNPVFDQFDVEPYAAFTGSYVDLIITGSMLASLTGDPTVANVRKVQGSVAAGQGGTTGSLQRFVSHVTENEMMYDAITPDFSDFASKMDASYFFYDSVNSHLLMFTGSDTSTSRGLIPVSKWFSFINSPGGAIVKQRSANAVSALLAKSYDEDDVEKSTGIISSNKLYISASSGYFGFGVGRVYLDADNDYGTASSTVLANYAKKYLWSFGRNGDFFKSAPQLVKHNNAFIREPLIRGFKYGLAGIFGNASLAKFRRDRFGQFRDMLEGSPNAAYLTINNSIEYPLEIKFSSRESKDGKGRQSADPIDTHCQNLSVYSTSSLPYFDGNAVDRTDDPDVRLKDLPMIF